MTADELKTKLAALEAQRAKLSAAVAQLDGAIGFCKGLVAEAEAKAPPTETPKE